MLQKQAEKKGLMCEGGEGAENYLMIH